jgi:itaconate CoA-transferase
VSAPDGTRPLSGVTVVSVEQAVAAPFATRQLADLGARVVKIERPGTGDFARAYDRTVDGISSVFVWLNRGKHSFCLDTKSAEGREILEDLLGGADVFVQNLSPAAAERAGFDTPAVRERHPHLIACGISGYGAGGPMRDAKAYDLLVQGETGIMSLTGDAANMAKVGISIADIAAGMYAYSGILAALVHRDRTGEALPVDVSLFDALTEWLAYPLYYTRYGGQAPQRMGTSHSTIAPYGSFATADGTLLLIAVQNDREWRRLCQVVLDDPGRADDPLFATNSDRIAHRSALDTLLHRRLSRLDPAQAQELLTRAGIAHSRINDITELAAHPQLTERDRWVDTPTPAGTTHTLYPPAVPGTARVDLGGVPALGQHSEETLLRMGRSAAEIETLREQKII